MGTSIQTLLSNTFASGFSGYSGGGYSGTSGYSGLISAVVSDTPPSALYAGQLWFDSSSGALFIWYSDGTSTQWVSVVGGAGPAGTSGYSGSGGGGGTGAPTISTQSGTTVTAAAGYHYILTNAAATTVTLPASPTVGDIIWVTPVNGLSTNVIARNGNQIQGLSQDMTIDTVDATIRLRWIDSTYDWRII